MSGAEPNTKRVSVPHPIPRDPGEYQATVHFGQRLRERVPQQLRDRVVRECIERGTCRGEPNPGSIDSSRDVQQAFKFERHIEGEDWIVVVGIVPEAFTEPDVKHLAITVYPVEEGDSNA